MTNIFWKNYKFLPTIFLKIFVNVKLKEKHFFIFPNLIIILINFPKSIKFRNNNDNNYNNQIREYINSYIQKSKVKGIKQGFII